MEPCYSNPCCSRASCTCRSRSTKVCTGACDRSLSGRMCVRRWADLLLCPVEIVFVEVTAGLWSLCLCAVCLLGAKPWPWVADDKAADQSPQSSQTLIPTPAAPPWVCPDWSLPFCFSLLPSFKVSVNESTLKAVENLNKKSAFVQQELRSLHIQFC